MERPIDQYVVPFTNGLCLLLVRSYTVSTRTQMFYNNRKVSPANYIWSPYILLPKNQDTGEHDLTRVVPICRTR